MANLQYIGARYVPKFYFNPDDSSNDWKSGVLYEALTIVTYNNDSYTSKITVPESVGNPTDNPQYWACTTKYTAALQALQTTVGDHENRIDTLEANDAKVDFLVTPELFGAVGDGVTDDTIAIQNAFDSGLIVEFSPKTYLFTRLNIRNDLIVFGNGCTLKASDYTGAGTLEGAIELQVSVINALKFDNVNFEQIRSASTNQYYNIFTINLAAFSNAVLNNVEFTNCNFKNFRNNAIYIQTALNSTSDGIRIDNCKFDGVDPTLTNIGDAFRIQLAYANYHGNYGIVNTKHIYITNCYAQYVRTLADIKRGCSEFEVSNCITHNIHDCHHSVDGSFNGQLHDLIMIMDSDFTPLTGTNFIEMQGEHIEVYNIKADGNGQTRDGIFITNYEYPGVSYNNQSIDFEIHDITIKNISNQGLRCSGGKDIVYRNCDIYNATQAALGADNTIFVDIDNNQFSTGNLTIDGVNDFGSANGFYILPSMLGVFKNCHTNNGQPRLANYASVSRIDSNLKFEGNLIGNFDVRILDANSVPVGFKAAAATCSTVSFHDATVLNVNDSTANVGNVHYDVTIDASSVGKTYIVEAVVAPNGSSGNAALIIQEWADSSYISSKVAACPSTITGVSKIVCSYVVEDSTCNRISFGVCPTQGQAVSTGDLNILSFKVYE